MRGLEIKNITKKFGSTTALEHVNLAFEENKIYGLLGRNGAGKTTLLNIINNRMYPNEGSVLLNGENIKENDKLLHNFYFVGEQMLYPDSLKVKDIFKWTKTFYPEFDMNYANKLSKMFELPLNKKTTGLSTGYKSIFKNVIALSVNTPYVFLDEPVLGLDANHRELFYRLLIEKYSENPFTIVISTHLIEEVTNVIENVIIIKNGQIIKNESRDELLKKGYTVTGARNAVDRYISDKEVIGTDNLGGLKTAYISGQPEKVIPDNLEISQMDLQKLFIQLTNI